MNLAALAVALGGGLVAGRLGSLISDCFAPPRRARRRIPLHEAATAAASVVVVARFDIGWAMVPPLVAAVSLVTLSAVDLRAYRLPDAITLPALGVSLAAVAVESVAAGRPGTLVPAVAAALGYGAVLWAAHGLRPGALGFGDVRLGPLLGLHLGWAAGASGLGWAAAVGVTAQALLLSSAAGVGTALVVAGLRRRGRDPLPDPDRSPRAVPGPRLLDTVFPFGPALAAGTMIVVLHYGPPA